MTVSRKTILHCRLVVVGALSIVRFRTAQKIPEILVYFLDDHCGICCELEIIWLLQ